MVFEEQEVLTQVYSRFSPSPYVWLKEAQLEFETTAQLTCKRLSYMRTGLNKPAVNYCKHPMCPSCWHRRFLSCISFLKLNVDGARYIQVQRLVDQLVIDRLDPKEIAAFKRRNTKDKFSLLCYLFDFPRVDRNEVEQRLVGVFVTPASVGPSGQDRLIKPDNGNWGTRLFRDEFAPSNEQLEWVIDYLVNTVAPPGESVLTCDQATLQAARTHIKKASHHGWNRSI